MSKKKFITFFTSVGFLVMILLAYNFYFFNYFDTKLLKSKLSFPLEKKQEKKIYYAGQELPFGKSIIYSGPVFTGKIDEINIDPSSENIILSIRSNKFIIDPSVSIITNLLEVNPRREVWKVLGRDALFDILKTKPIVTMRYDNEKINQYGIIIHNYASD